MININTTNFQKNIMDYLNQAVIYKDVININTQNGNAIIMSEEEYSGLMETLYLMSHSKTADEILEAMRENRENCKEYDPAEEW